uniref:Uncharacterized protein TCIL3000_11_13720 n=1 Tax=Trypanosoma congolense (strain IL3000) TaxID=1068625 RepID=G0V2J4_TRYCI|nr:unnamed protein product [Trypanosoma congolense IL3000]
MGKRRRAGCSATPIQPHASEAVNSITTAPVIGSNETEQLEKFVTQLDLLIPAVKHFDQLILPAGVVFPENEPPSGCVGGKGVNAGSDEEVTASALLPCHNFNLRYRFDVLRSFTIPTHVYSYLQRILLTTPAASTDSDECCTKQTSKRVRKEPMGQDDVGEVQKGTSDTELAIRLRRTAEILLPPFEDDSDFIVAHEMGCVLRLRAHEDCGLEGPRTQVLGILIKSRLDLFRQCQPCRSMISDLYHHHMTVRVQKMKLPPRVMRLSQKLKLDEQECAALVYLLVCHCGSVFPVEYTRGVVTPNRLALHNGMSPVELMHFLADYRGHVKQGVVSVESRYRTTFTESRVYMPQEVIGALSGNNLSPDQLVKLEKTHLGDVIMEESTHSVAHKGRGKKHDSGRGEYNNGNMAQCPNRGDLGTSSEDRNGVINHNKDDECSESQSTSSCGTCDASEFDLDGVSGNRSDLGPLDIMITDGSTEAYSKEGGGHVSPGREHAGSHPTAALNGQAKLGTKVSSAITPDNSFDRPYENDIEYMDESFKLLANIVRLHAAESDMKDEEDAILVAKNKVEATIRELRGKVRIGAEAHRLRTEATLKCGKFIPRAEALSKKLQLSDLEKRVLLLMVGNVVSHDILIAINGRYAMRDGQRVMTVGYILFVLCANLRERVDARRSFYLSGPLISNGVLSLSLDTTGRNCFNTDLMDYIVDIDRKIVDHLMGTETETSELVPGSRLYSPSVSMSSVILPQATTTLVLSTIEHYSMFEQCKKSCGFGEGLGTGGSGLVFLFYGPSGTGKTMLANAVAHELKKRILLVNMLHFKSDLKGPDFLRFLFREAKLNDALIFFDECETLFEARENNPFVTSVLAEFEKHDGIIILATNKAQVMDEAMNRRISLMVEFHLPDQQMREGIWRAHIPSSLPLHEDVSIFMLSLNFELSGGLIRNAVLAAINKAVARERSSAPTLRMQDLEEGARQQLRGFFLACKKPTGAATKSYHTPKRSLSDLVLEPDTHQQLEAIVRLAKGRTTLFAQWGFCEDDCDDSGTLYLFYGPSGSGKSLAAEGIAYECATSIRLCNLSELLLVDKLEVDTVFTEALKLGAIIVFDQAQVLFNHSEKGAHIAKLIHYHAKRYPRAVIFLVTTGTSDSVGIDRGSTPLTFQKEIRFSLPTQTLRRKLWERAIPDKVPMEPDGIDFEELSKISLSPRLIRASMFSACCRVAMLPSERRFLTMQLLREEIESAQLREKRSQSYQSMFV